MRTWLSHLTRGEIEDAFELCTAATRSRLAVAEEAWFAGREHPLAPADRPAEDARRDSGLTLFRRLVAGPGFHWVPPLPADAADRVERAEIDGDRATVRVRTATGFEEASLAFESGAWRVAMLDR